MKKIIKFALITLTLLALYFTGSLLSDKLTLKENLLRLHIVANSDSEIDQGNKLKVRDAVLAFLENNMLEVASVQDAKEFVLSYKDQLEDVVNSTLASVKAGYTGKVSLQYEAFDKRIYDTFSLPAGVYNAIKIDLGNADGKNWWCVAFPALCLPTTGEELRNVAVEAGLQEEVVSTITERDGYKIRFFFLDCLGKIENFFYFS